MKAFLSVCESWIRQHSSSSPCCRRRWNTTSIAARFSHTKSTRLPARDVVGDQVGDGLRLAGAGRALDDVAATACARARLPRAAWRRRARRGHSSLRATVGGSSSSSGRGSTENTRSKASLDEILLEQRPVVAHQRHLPIVEIAQRHGAEIEVPRNTDFPARCFAQRKRLSLRVLPAVCGLGGVTICGGARRHCAASRTRCGSGDGPDLLAKQLQRPAAGNPRVRSCSRSSRVDRLRRRARSFCRRWNWPRRWRAARGSARSPAGLRAAV